MSDFRFFSALTVLFLLLLFLFEGGVYFVFKHQYSSSLESLKNNEITAVNNYDSIISTKVEWLMSDLGILANHIEVHRWSESSKSSEGIEHEFRMFSQARKVYDQIRLIDKDGIEVVRVNFINGAASVVPKEALQNKSGRYYFKDTMALEKGQIYASPLDLNIEHGHVEVPHKPMIRFGTPIFNSRGQRTGAIVMNFFGDVLLKSLAEASRIARGDFMLVNQDGFWLMGGAAGDNWGFMFADGQDRTFESRFPATWAAMQSSELTQIQEASGLFSWKAICPLTAPSEHIRQGADAEPLIAKPALRGDYRWWLVSHVSDAQLQAFRQSHQGKLNPLYVAAAFLAFIAALLMVTYVERRKKQRVALENLAHFDQMTGLPNRNRLSHIFEQAEEANGPPVGKRALFMIDLDGFKGVNDNHGHACGDWLLKEVAIRFKEVVRKQDKLFRVGGDEFCLLISESDCKEDLELIADKILEVLKSPFNCDEVSFYIGASIGITVYPDKEKPLHVLMKEADKAMYQAKNSGKAKYCFFNPEA